MDIDEEDEEEEEEEQDQEQEHGIDYIDDASTSKHLPQKSYEGNHENILFYKELTSEALHSINATTAPSTKTARKLYPNDIRGVKGRRERGKTDYVVDFLLRSVAPSPLKPALKHSVQGITKNAYSKIKYFIGHFTSGFSTDNLPKGFVLKQTAYGKVIIDYNPSEYEDPDPNSGDLEFKVSLDKEDIFLSRNYSDVGKLNRYADFSDCDASEIARLQSLISGRRDTETIAAVNSKYDWILILLLILDKQDVNNEYLAQIS